jgi:myo-inositol-1(or 4)-monophosphatase
MPFARELAAAAAAVILPHFRTPLTIDDKGGRGVFDPVTEADRGAEAAMRRLIGSRHPDHGILGEEYGAERLEADFVWVLDPVDGTRAFISGLPLWGTLIGLRHQGEPVLGLVAQPYIGEVFIGTRDGAWLERGNDKTPLRTRRCAAMSEATVSSTGPYLFAPDDWRRFDRLQKAAKLVRYGYDCYAYAMVAGGFIDCVAEAGLGPYDIEPLVPIIEGAGGVVTDWEGKPKRGGGQSLAIGDPTLLEEALRLLAE